MRGDEFGDGFGELLALRGTIVTPAARAQQDSNYKIASDCDRITLRTRHRNMRPPLRYFGVWETG